MDGENQRFTGIEERKVAWVAERDGISRAAARIKVRLTIHATKQLWGLPPAFELRFYEDCAIAEPATDEELGFVAP